MAKPQTALKYEVEVTESGSIELPVPFPAGARVVVVVFEQAQDALNDLIGAAQSSTDFWDNPCDDEDWNNA
ncbi:MAG TPA: hypothetical protein VG013_18370, partial [Gemmataceae bacterium]|jgi:hypothetical protein|nr:hypothetical protein [Gemmataceae bacterium]